MTRRAADRRRAVGRNSSCFLVTATTPAKTPVQQYVGSLPKPGPSRILSRLCLRRSLIWDGLIPPVPDAPHAPGLLLAGVLVLVARRRDHRAGISRADTIATAVADLDAIAEQGILRADHSIRYKHICRAQPDSSVAKFGQVALADCIAALHSIKLYVVVGTHRRRPIAFFPYIA